MNNKIKEAANKQYPPTKDVIQGHVNKYQRTAFLAGATYFQQSSGADEMAGVLEYALSEISWFAEKYPATAAELQRRIKKPLAKYQSFISSPTSSGE